MASVNRLEEVFTPERSAAVIQRNPRDGTRRGRSRRRAVVSHISLPSVARLALAYWAAVGVFIVCATSVTYFVLRSIGVVGNVERFAGDLTNDKNFHLLSAQLLLFLVLVTVTFVLIATTLTVVGAAFYNLAARALGGVRVDLRDDRLSPRDLRA